jgi:hypothetical protein
MYAALHAGYDSALGLTDPADERQLMYVICLLPCCSSPTSGAW